VCSGFFPDNLWPSYEEYQAGMETWLNANYASYLTELGKTEWLNAFAGKHHSLAIIFNYLQLFSIIVNYRQLIIQQILT